MYADRNAALTIPDLREYQKRRSFEHSVFLRATPEQVWRALTDPTELDRWETVSSEVDLRPGGKFRFEFEYGPPDDGMFLDVNPPRRLVQHWMSKITDEIRLDLMSVLTLTPGDQGTGLWIRMSGYGDEDDQEWLLETMREGWRNDLVVLKIYLETGRDARPTIWPGVSLNARCITVPAHRRLDLGVSSGAYVLDVYPSGPAADAGLRRGDVIVAFGGFPAHTRADLVGALERLSPGDRVIMEFFRDGTRRFSEVVLVSQIVPRGLENAMAPASATGSP